MKDNKELVSEMEGLLEQLRGFKAIYDLNNNKTDIFLSNYVQVTDNIKIKLMELSSELIKDY